MRSPCSDLWKLRLIPYRKYQRTFHGNQSTCSDRNLLLLNILSEHINLKVKEIKFYRYVMNSYNGFTHISDNSVIYRQKRNSKLDCWYNSQWHHMKYRLAYKLYGHGESIFMFVGCTTFQLTIPHALRSMKGRKMTLAEWDQLTVVPRRNMKAVG